MRSGGAGLDHRSDLGRSWRRVRGVGVCARRVPAAQWRADPRPVAESGGAAAQAVHDRHGAGRAGRSAPRRFGRRSWRLRPGRIRTGGPEDSPTTPTASGRLARMVPRARPGRSRERCTCGGSWNWTPTTPAPGTPWGTAKSAGGGSPATKSRGNGASSWNDGRWRLSPGDRTDPATEPRSGSRNDWLMRFRRLPRACWRPKSRAACEEIAAVRDPQAVKALAQLLHRRAACGRQVLYIDVAGRDPHAGRLQALSTRRSRIRMKRSSTPAWTGSSSGNRRSWPPVLAYLKDANNVRLNRAAHALGRLEDKWVISPLIEALVTTHYIVLPAKIGPTPPLFDPPGATPALCPRPARDSPPATTASDPAHGHQSGGAAGPDSA